MIPLQGPIDLVNTSLSMTQLVTAPLDADNKPFVESVDHSENQDSPSPNNEGGRLSVAAAPEPTRGLDG